MSVLLAIDTAAPRLALAILRDGDHVDTLIEDMATGQAERLFPALDDLLGRSGVTYKDLTRVAVTIRQSDRIVAELEYEIPLTRLALLQKLEERAAVRTIEHASAHATVTHANDLRRDLQPETRP